MKFLVCAIAVAALSLSASAVQARDCRATVRSAGSANLIPSIARHSAVNAWRREVTAVHGRRFAAWSNARNIELIRDDNDGAMVRYVAKAQPCREWRQ